jgi:predicted RNase H-like HicB family nuclease
MTRKQIKERAARFVKFVEWSDEDQCFIGRCPALFGGGVHGNDEAKGYAELCQTVEEWIELLDQDGVPLPATNADSKKFSGKFVLRVERLCTGVWRPKRLRPGKVSIVFARKRWLRRERKSRQPMA